MRLFFRLTAIVALSLTLAGCDWEREYRFRLTLVVSTPESRLAGVPIEGSGVWTFYYAKVGFVTGRPLTMIIGPNSEAFEVDLGTRGKFFVLLSGSKDRNPAIMAYRVANKERTHHGRFERVEALGRLNKPIYIEDYSDLPLLVRFRDPADPTTAERIDPNDLAKSFGPGVRLLNARLERTDNPLTSGLGKILSWLDLVPPDKRLAVATRKPPKDIPPERRLTYQDFRTPAP